MRKLLILALLCSPALAQNFGYNGQCATGGQAVITQGLLSSGTQPLLGSNPNVGSGVIASYPSCIVTVYLTGSGTLATLASSKAGAPLTNPFTANTNGSFLFFSVAGEYDVVISGAGLPSTVTLTDIQLGATGGGGGGTITLQTSGITNTNQILLNLAAGPGLSVSNALGTTTYSNTGILSITTDAGTVTGAFTNSATDYGVKGIQQLGSGTLSIASTNTGTLVVGNSANRCTFFPVASGGFACIDTNGNFLATGASVGFSPAVANSPGWELSATNGSSVGTAIFGNRTDIFGFISAFSLSSLAFDFNAAAANFNIPINIAGSLTATGTSQVQNLTVLGTCTGCASGSVATVSGTASQIVNTGTATNPVLALYGGPTGASAPLQFPGNIAETQFANGDDSFKQTRKTDTSPTGTFLVGRAAGGPVLYQVDVLGNGFFNSLSTSNATSAGYFGFEQGPDALSACETAAAANVICFYAPTSVTEQGRIWSGALPGSSNGNASVWSNAVPSVETLMPLSGSTAANVGCGTASLAAAANGNIIVGDGSGCMKNGGVNISTVLPSIQGPVGAFTTTSLTGVTVFTYTTSIQGSTQVNIDCNGSYKFTGSVEQAAFALNFTSAPTNMFLGVEIGVNTTTGTHVYGRQTTNGALVTSSLAAAATGTYYPVWIHGGVLTGSSTTFSVVAATSNAAGTVNIDASSFICSVK